MSYIVFFEYNDNVYFIYHLAQQFNIVSFYFTKFAAFDFDHPPLSIFPY